MTPWLTDDEINDLCSGLVNNAAKIRYLRSMGLTVNRKPCGRPLVMRAHAEVVLSGTPQTPLNTTSVNSKPVPNIAQYRATFCKNRKAA